MRRFGFGRASSDERVEGMSMNQRFEHDADLQTRSRAKPADNNGSHWCE